MRAGVVLVLVLVAQACSRGGGPGVPASPEQPPAAGSAGDGPGETAPAVPEARTEVGGGLLDGKIVVLGGLRADGTATDRVDVYDPDQQRWSAGPALPVTLHHMGVASLGGRLFVAGGYTPGPGGAWVETAEVRSLGPGEGQWRPEPALPAPRGGIAGAAVAGAPCVAGEEAPSGTIASVECLRGDRWERRATLSTARHGLAVVAAAERLHVLAGGDQPGLFVTDVHEVLGLG